MSPKTLPEILERSAALHSERVAVVDPSGRTVTYGELDRQADALAEFLRTQGIGRGHRVGVVAPKSANAVVALFGIMKAGAAYVPVDCSAPAERGRRILVDCRCSAIVVDGEAHKFVPDETELPDLRAVISLRDSGGPSRPKLVTRLDGLRHSAHLTSAAPPDESDLAYIIFTSGSTGVPKGVMITHANAMSFVEWCAAEFQVTQDDRFANHAPFYFDPSVIDLYVSARVGASVYLIPEDVGRHPAELGRFIARHRLTFWNSTPSVLMMLLQYAELQAMAAWSPRTVVFGGEVFPPRHLRELQRRWSGATFVNLYGPTETTTACTFSRVPASIPPGRTAPYPIGFPCSHCRATALDGGGREVAAGEAGVLHISGASVFAGYWDRPAETAEAIRWRGGVRWYNTGDVVRWDPAEGFTYAGRQDRMVKRHGFRIELAEIELALYSHPAIRGAAAVAIPDSDTSTHIVVAVACEGETPSVIELKTFCRSLLPSYMIPDRFVFRGSLPKTPTDKIDYRAVERELNDAPVAD